MHMCVCATVCMCVHVHVHEYLCVCVCVMGRNSSENQMMDRSLSQAIRTEGSKFQAEWEITKSPLSGIWRVDPEGTRLSQGGMVVAEVGTRSAEGWD